MSCRFYQDAKSNRGLSRGGYKESLASHHFFYKSPTQDTPGSLATIASGGSVSSRPSVSAYNNASPRGDTQTLS
jgi:hypothetical protein